MSPRAIALSAAAALVAVGGVYLLIEVRSSGAAAPSEKAIAEAAKRSGRSGIETSAAPEPPTRRDSIPRPDSPPPRPRDKGVSRFANPSMAAMPGGMDVRPDDPPPVGSDDEAQFQQAMLETNKLYDRHNYEDARSQALKLLERRPGTVRMLRVVVSSSCILGDAETAQRYWNELPEGDRIQMTERCSRYDVTFTDKRK